MSVCVKVVGLLGMMVFLAQSVDYGCGLGGKAGIEGYERSDMG